MSIILVLIALLAAGHSVSGEACKQDLLFLVIGSSTICEGKPADACPNWKTVIDFIKNMIRSLTIGPDDTKVAFLKIGNETDLRWNLNQHTDETSLLAAIDGETFPGGQLTRTDFIEVIVSDVFNTSVGDRPNVPNVVILITDSTNIDRQRAKEASEKLQEAGKLKIFVVCVGDGCSEDGAKAVSSYPHEKGVTYFMPKKYVLLESVREKLEEQICDLLRAEEED